MWFDLSVGVAEHLLPSKRVHDAAGFEVPIPHALLRPREGQREPFYALAQRRFDTLAIGDVAHDDLDRTAIRVLDECAGDVHLCGAAIQPHNLLFDRLDLLAGHQPIEHVAQARVALGAKDVEDRPTDELLAGGSTEQPCRRSVQERDTTVLNEDNAVR